MPLPLGPGHSLGPAHSHGMGALVEDRTQSSAPAQLAGGRDTREPARAGAAGRLTIGGAASVGQSDPISLERVVT